MRGVPHITALAVAHTCSCTAGRGGFKGSWVASTGARGAAATTGPERWSDASLGNSGVE